MPVWTSFFCLQIPLASQSTSLHKQYEEKKDEINSACCDINKEGFMTILGEIWEEWVTPDQLIKAGKKVSLSADGLNVNWMDQKKV